MSDTLVRAIKAEIKTIRSEVRELEHRGKALEKALAALDGSGTSSVRTTVRLHQTAVRDGHDRAIQDLKENGPWEGALQDWAKRLQIQKSRLYKGVAAALAEGTIQRNGSTGSNARYFLPSQRATVVRPGEGVSEGRVLA